MSKIWGPFFWEKKAPAATYPQVQGFQKYGGHFSEKKAPAATYPQDKGFQKFGPLGIQAEKQGFRTAWLITGQKFPWKNLKSGLSLLLVAFWDLSSHICKIFMIMARWWDLHFMKKSRVLRPKNMFPKRKMIYDIVSFFLSGHAVPLFFRAKIFRAVPCQDFPCHNFPCRAVP